VAARDVAVLGPGLGRGGPQRHRGGLRARLLRAALRGRRRGPSRWAPPRRTSSTSRACSSLPSSCMRWATTSGSRARRARRQTRHGAAVCMALPADFMDALQFPAGAQPPPRAAPRLHFRCRRCSDECACVARLRCWRQQLADGWDVATPLRSGHACFQGECDSTAAAATPPPHEPPPQDNFWSGSAPTDRGTETSPYLNVSCRGGWRGGGRGTPRRRAQPADRACAACRPLWPPCRGAPSASRMSCTARTLVVWPTTTLGGRLLHPSRPATTLDAGWASRAHGWRRRMRSAHSRPPLRLRARRPAAHIPLAARRRERRPSVPAALSAGQLWPRPSACDPALGVAVERVCVRRGGRPRGRLRLPAAAAGAAQQVQRAAAGALRSTDRVPWSLWTVAPALPSGYALLGELQK